MSEREEDVQKKKVWDPLTGTEPCWDVCKILSSSEKSLVVVERFVCLLKVLNVKKRKEV